jgi:hypothetical protein
MSWLNEGKDISMNKAFLSKFFGIFDAGGFGIEDNLYGLTNACCWPEGGMRRP